MKKGSSETKLCDVTSRKTVIWVPTALRISNLNARNVYHHLVYAVQRTWQYSHLLNSKVISKAWTLTEESDASFVKTDQHIAHKLVVFQLSTVSSIWMGNRGIAPPIPNLGTGARWVVTFKLRPLYGRKRASGAVWIGGLLGPWVSLDTVEKRNFCFCKELKPYTLTVQPVGWFLCRLKPSRLIVSAIKVIKLETKWAGNVSRTEGWPEHTKLFRKTWRGKPRLMLTYNINMGLTRCVRT